MSARQRSSLSMHAPAPACRSLHELAFRIVKRVCGGLAKVRYCGILKNTNRVFATFAMANLYRIGDQIA
jgi:hypothetical protein